MRDPFLSLPISTSLWRELSLSSFHSVSVFWSVAYKRCTVSSRLRKEAFWKWFYKKSTENCLWLPDLFIILPEGSSFLRDVFLPFEYAFCHLLLSCLQKASSSFEVIGSMYKTQRILDEGSRKVIRFDGPTTNQLDENRGYVEGCRRSLVSNCGDYPSHLSGYGDGSGRSAPSLQSHFHIATMIALPISLVVMRK